MFFPFNLKLGAQLTTYAGVILAFSAAAGWLREDAKNDARSEIRAEFAKANEDLRLEVARRVKKADDLQRILLTTETEAASLLARRWALSSRLSCARRRPAGSVSRNSNTSGTRARGAGRTGKARDGATAMPSEGRE